MLGPGRVCPLALLFSLGTSSEWTHCCRVRAGVGSSGCLGGFVTVTETRRGAESTGTTGYFRTSGMFPFKLSPWAVLCYLRGGSRGTPRDGTRA